MSYYFIHLTYDNRLLLGNYLGGRQYYQMIDKYNREALWGGNIKLANGGVAWGAALHIDNQSIFMKVGRNNTWVIGVDPEEGVELWETPPKHNWIHNILLI